MQTNFEGDEWSSSMEAFQFGPYPTTLGSPKKDREFVSEGTAFYAGSGKDILTSGSMPIFGDDFPGGFLVNPVVMSGGLGKDTYKFEADAFEWAFIADAGGGKDVITFQDTHPFNPEYYDETIQIDTVLINKRDVLVISTDLTDGGRTNGIIFSDPFGRLDKSNKLEKVKFGNNNYKFKKFYKSLVRASKSDEDYGQLYNFSKSTYSELGAAGVLNLQGIDDLSTLDDGSYIGIATFNNSIVDGLAA